MKLPVCFCVSIIVHEQEKNFVETLRKSSSGAHLQLIDIWSQDGSYLIKHIHSDSDVLYCRSRHMCGGTELYTEGPIYIQQ